MRYVYILAAVAAGYFGYQKYQSTQTQKQAEAAARAQDPDKTPAGNAENRMNNLTGAAPGL